MADTLTTVAARDTGYPNYLTGALARLAKLMKDFVTTGAGVQLAGLASGIAPSHVVKFAGTYTTAGGAAAEDITGLTGVVAGDICIVSLRQKGATPRTILTAIPATDKITLTFSDDPSTDHKVDYIILRAAS